MHRYEHGGAVREGGGLLDFSINVNPLGMPESAKRAIAENIESFSAYPDCDCRALREAIAERHGVRPGEILCGNGASDLIFRIAALFAGRTALTLAPTFSEYERAVELFGGRVLLHPLREENGFRLTESILPRLTEDVGLFFLCNPNNPTGRRADPALIAAILERCGKNGTLLVIDECFLDFTEGDSLLPKLSEYPNLLILKAFTKFYGMAGLRLGYLIGEPRLLSRIRPFGPEWSVSAVAQAAGLAALNEKDWAARTRSLVAAERAYLAEALTKLGLTVLEGEGNFLLVRGDRPLGEALQQKKIYVRDCDNFVGLGARYFRIGLKTREKNEALVSAIREVLE